MNHAAILNNQMRGNVATGATLRYRVGFIRNGVRHLLPWRNNLILDSGLNKVGTVYWANCFTFCLFGSQASPEAASRDSGTTTFTVVGSTCTSSGNYFIASDVGRLIKFDGVGGEYYIQSYTSATIVTLVSAPSPAITAETGCVWYVERTALQTLHSATSTYDTSGGGCGTSDASNVRTMKRTFVGAAVGAPVTLTEIGFNDSGSNAALFDRDIIPGTISLSIGDQPTAICELALTFTPNASTAVGNVATGYNSSGNHIVAIMSSSSVSSAGATNNTNGTQFEPKDAVGARSPNATFTLPVFGATGNMPACSDSNTNSLNGYSSGNFYRDKLCSFNVSTANGTIYGILLGTPGNVSMAWVQKFTTPFTKTSSDVLSYTFRVAWQRLLTNPP